MRPPTHTTAKWPLPNAKISTSVHHLCAAGYQLSNTRLHLVRPWGFTFNASSPLINSCWLRTVLCSTSALNKRLRYSTALIERHDYAGGYWDFCTGVFWWAVLCILLLEQKEGLKSEHPKKWMKKTSSWPVKGTTWKLSPCFPRRIKLLFPSLATWLHQITVTGEDNPGRFALHFWKCHLKESQTRHTFA